MAELADLELAPELLAELPDLAGIVEHLRSGVPNSVSEVLRSAHSSGRPVVQPRCGVGGHAEMLELLRGLDAVGPGILSVTIDSHTRLRRFEVAADVLMRDPGDLNGYPLVTHGWQRGRELCAAVEVPLEVRHGSPDPRELFAVALASGISSFEGGGISYNLPYSKDVPLTTSLRAWQRVDHVCGQLAAAGVIIDRELFGSLTGVLVPPSISLAISLLEGIAAAREGVRCLSVAYPQGAESHQDIAALRTIPVLFKRYLDPGVQVYPVLHEFMGAFPSSPEAATALITQGGLIARLGGAAKVVNKTVQEAHGVPGVAANAAGIRAAVLGASQLFDFVEVDEGRVAEEAYWIEREVEELVQPVLEQDDPVRAISSAFAAGTLDIPFSASLHARSQVLPRRDRHGGIRFGEMGALPFSAQVRRRNDACLANDKPDGRSLLDTVIDDIYYCLRNEAQYLQFQHRRRP